MQFPVFPGPELINWEGLLRQRNICFCHFFCYNSIGLQFVFLVHSKMNSNKKECMNPEDRRFKDVKQLDIAPCSSPEAKPLEIF